MMATQRLRGGRTHPRKRLIPLLLALSLVLAACGNGDDDVDVDADADVDTETEEEADADADADADAEADEPAATGWEPDGPITMVVPFAAGGGSDVLGRAVVSGLEEVRPDLELNVENRTGGAGGVGYGYFAEQAGDPLFLLPAEVTRSVLPATQDVPFDWDTWTSVGMFFEDIGFFMVSTDSEWEDIESFMADAVEAADAGRPLTVGVPAAGGIDEVLAVGLAEVNNTTFEIVAYDGTGETNPALQGGDINATVGNPSDSRQEIEAGLFRALLGFAGERLDDDIFGEVPVAAEFDWELTATKYRGIIMPPDVPEEAVDYFEAALREWTETDGFTEYQENAGLATNILWREDWDDFIENVWNPQVVPGLAPAE